jgi:hypothetical protein
LRRFDRLRQSRVEIGSVYWADAACFFLRYYELVKTPIG